MSETDGEGGEVVPLFGVGDVGDDGNPLLRKPFAHDHSCATFCRTAELDAKTERAYCRTCKREIPLFHLLQMLAGDPARYIEARKETERRARLARGRLDELLRLERNVKTRLRRSEVPLTDVQTASRTGERNARTSA